MLLTASGHPEFAQCAQPVQSVGTDRPKAVRARSAAAETIRTTPLRPDGGPGRLNGP